MPEFRAYVVGPGGHFIVVHEFTAANESEATKLALHYVASHPVELWKDDKQIGVFNPAQSGHPIFARLRKRGSKKK
jgi:hypothetical protein